MPNDLVINKARETKKSIEEIESLWREAVNKQLQLAKSKDERDKGNPAFWDGVKVHFQQMIDKIDIEEAKNIMDNRNQYEELAGQFVDAMQRDDYVKAQEVFPQLVQTKVDALINNKQEAYLKKLGQQCKEASEEG